MTKTKINLGFIDSNTLPSYEAVYERLRKYEDLEEQGKLLKLPCAVGDTVYTVYSISEDRKLIYDFKLDALHLALNAIKREFGKTIFLTREEAKAALKESGDIRQQDRHSR